MCLQTSQGRYGRVRLSLRVIRSSNYRHNRLKWFEKYLFSYGLFRSWNCPELVFLNCPGFNCLLLSLLLTLLLLLYKFPRPCIVFFGNRSGGPGTGHRVRPQVADRGVLYRGLMLNTDTKLNKQSRTMFQGWSWRNNPQAKVLTTVPRAAWHQGVVSHTVSLGNQATS